MYNVRSVSKGEYLVRAGGLEPYVFLLKTGQLAASKATPSGGVKLLGIIKPGDFVGEMAYLSEKYVNASDVIAVEDSEVIEIQFDNLFDALAANPVWLKAIIKSLVRRIEELNSKI